MTAHDLRHPVDVVVVVDGAVDLIATVVVDDQGGAHVQGAVHVHDQVDDHDHDHHHVFVRGFVQVLIVLLLVACSPRKAPPQPLPFDHSIHTRIALEDRPLACVDCHAGAEKGSHAGLPALATCLRCHMRPQGEPPTEREREVRLAAARGGPFRWIQVTRNPGHVFFSHAAHVSLAKLECATCHGDVASWRTPPRAPEARLTSMRRCMACHRERGASNSCETCHQ